MEETKKDTISKQLLTARKETLSKKNQNQSVHHGEFYGMQVYSLIQSDIKTTLEELRVLENPIIWVMNTDTTHDFSEEKHWLSEEVEAIIAFGEKNKELRYNIESSVSFFARKDNLTQALELLKKIAHTGNTVFFSPGKGEEGLKWETEFNHFLNEAK